MHPPKLCLPHHVLLLMMAGSCYASIPGASHPGLAGPTVIRAGDSFINPVPASIGLGEELGMEWGAEAALLRWSRCREHLCMEGAGGKRIGSIVIESSHLAAPCTAHGMAQPTHGSQQHLEPLPGVSTPEQPLSRSPARAGLAEGLTTGNGFGKTPLCQHTGQTPRDCRLF